MATPIDGINRFRAPFSTEELRTLAGAISYDCGYCGNEDYEAETDEPPSISKRLYDELRAEIKYRAQFPKA